MSKHWTDKGWSDEMRAMDMAQDRANKNGAPCAVVFRMSTRLYSICDDAEELEKAEADGGWDLIMLVEPMEQES